MCMCVCVRMRVSTVWNDPWPTSDLVMDSWRAAVFPQKCNHCGGNTHTFPAAFGGYAYITKQCPAFRPQQCTCLLSSKQHKEIEMHSKFSCFNWRGKTWERKGKGGQMRFECTHHPQVHIIIQERAICYSAFPPRCHFCCDCAGHRGFTGERFCLLAQMWNCVRQCLSVVFVMETIN